MKPTIDSTKFGWIKIEGETFDHDILIRLDGQVIKRKKKLSKEIYGTSHILSLAESEFIYEDSATHLLIGSGQEGELHLSEEAQAYFKDKCCKVDLLPTPKAIKAWNAATGNVIGVFHVTC
jgi:hypothetical protein